MSQRKIHSKIIHIITRILINSSFGVLKLNFMLAECRQNFVQLASTKGQVDRPAVPYDEHG